MPDATERRVLAICVFIAGCILLMPGERVSAGAAFVLAVLIAAWHVARTKREAAAQPATEASAQPAAASGAATAPSEGEGGA